MPNPPVVNDEQARIDSILNGTDAIFEIDDNQNTDPRWHEGYAIHSIGKSVVETYDAIIVQEAQAAGVNADLVKAIMYVENSQGYIRDNYGAPALGREPSSLLPMNIQPSTWGGIGGIDSADFSHPILNIRAGTLVLKGITDRLAPEDQTFENIASIWNGTSRTETADFGARVANVASLQLWEGDSVKGIGNVFVDGSVIIDGYMTRNFVEEAILEGVDLSVDAGQEVGGFLSQLGGDILNIFADISNNVGNVVTTLQELIPDISFSDESSYGGQTYLDTTFSLQNLTGTDVDILLGFSGNEGWQDNFLQLNDGSEYFIYEDTMVLRNSGSVLYEYEVFNFTDQLFSNISDHVTMPGVNDYFDFATDFIHSPVDATNDNSWADFERGHALDGGNYLGTMPLDILNGDFSQYCVANDNHRWYEKRIVA